MGMNNLPQGNVTNVPYNAGNKWQITGEGRGDRLPSHGSTHYMNGNGMADWQSGSGFPTQMPQPVNYGPWVQPPEVSPAVTPEVKHAIARGLTGTVHPQNNVSSGITMGKNQDPNVLASMGQYAGAGNVYNGIPQTGFGGPSHSAGYAPGSFGANAGRNWQSSNDPNGHFSWGH
jgi:hypothetical protein